VIVPEFSRPVRADTIGAEPRQVAVEAEAHEREALAARFGLLRLDQLEAEAELRRTDTGIRAEGRVKAILAQACIATGDPVEERIDEPFALVFRPAPAGGEPDEEVELAEAELDIVHHEGNSVDVGEAAAQTLALALNPYPRSPAAAEALKAAGVKSEEEAGPFGALAALRDKLGKTDEP